MKVILVPGPRNEELIREILEFKAKTAAAQDFESFESSVEWIGYVDACASMGDEYMDALYYACENGDEMLEEQGRYFHDCLLYDEKYYYAARMGGYEPD